MTRSSILKKYWGTKAQAATLINTVEASSLDVNNVLQQAHEENWAKGGGLGPYGSTMFLIIM